MSGFGRVSGLMVSCAAIGLVGALGVASAASASGLASSVAAGSSGSAGLVGSSSGLPLGAVAVDSSVAYVTDAGAGVVSLVQDGRVVRTVPVGADPVAVAADTVDHVVYVANKGSNTVSVVTGPPAEAVVSRTVDLGSVGGLSGVAVDSADQSVFAAGLNEVAVIKAGAVSSRVFGNFTGAVAVDAQTRTAYAGTSAGGVVQIRDGVFAGLISLASNAPVTHLAADSRTHTLYASTGAGIAAVNETTGTVSKVNVPASVSGQDLIADPTAGVVYALGERTLFALQAGSLLGRVPSPNVSSQSGAVDPATHALYLSGTDGAGHDQLARLERAPHIDGVTPNIGLIDGGQPITITGTGFLGTSTVAIGNHPATNITVVNDREIRVDTPATTQLGPVGVTVHTATLRATTTMPAAFTYVPTPRIASVSDDPQPGQRTDTVEVTGWGLSQATGIQFANGATSPATIINDNTITAAVPTNVDNSNTTITVLFPWGMGANPQADFHHYYISVNANEVEFNAGHITVPRAEGGSYTATCPAAFPHIGSSTNNGFADGFQTRSDNGAWASLYSPLGDDAVKIYYQNLSATVAHVDVLLDCRR